MQGTRVTSILFAIISTNLLLSRSLEPTLQQGSGNALVTRDNKANAVNTQVPGPIRGLFFSEPDCVQGVAEVVEGVAGDNGVTSIGAPLTRVRPPNPWETGTVVCPLVPE